MKLRIILASCAVLSATSMVSQAASMLVGLQEFTGDTARIGVNITEIAGGKLKFTVSLNTTGNGGAVTDGDISGFWAHISDESLLGGLSITGGTETIGTLFTGANAINNLPGGGGQNLNGGSPAGALPMDFGFRVGDSNGNDDIETFMFTLQHSSASLDLSHFQNQWLGARLQSTNGNAGSSKLVGKGRVRPPNNVAASGSAAFFMLIGLGAIEGFRRRFAAKG